MGIQNTCMTYHKAISLGIQLKYGLKYWLICVAYLYFLSTLSVCIEQDCLLTNAENGFLKTNIQDTF